MHVGAIRYYYYFDLLQNYIIFGLGAQSLLLGLGGILLHPPEQGILSYPYIHGSGLIIGVADLLTCFMVFRAPNGIKHVRIAILFCICAIIFISMATGFLTDEIVLWTEMPYVNFMGKDSIANEVELVAATHFNSFIMLHTLRCLANFANAIVSACSIYFRLVSFGLLQYDTIISEGNKFMRDEVEPTQDEFTIPFEKLKLYAFDANESESEKSVRGEQQIALLFITFST